MWKIKLTLKNNIVLELNDVRYGSPGWSACQPVNIKKLSFSFEGFAVKGKKEIFEIVLSGMSEYNFFVEAMQNVLGGRTQIKAFWFMGKIPNTDKIVGYIIKENVIALNAVVGKEFNGTATSGWKSGLSDGKPFIDLLRR